LSSSVPKSLLDNERKRRYRFVTKFLTKQSFRDGDAGSARCQQNWLAVYDISTGQVRFLG